MKSAPAVPPAPVARHRLGVLEKVGFGAGDAAVNVVISAMILIVGYFYTDVFGLAPEDLWILFLVVRIFDGLIDPLIGWVNDRFTTRWGRYRPYFIFVPVPLAISTVLMFTTPDLDYNGKLVWAYATYLLVTVMFSLVTIPYISLIGVLTDSTADRLSANGYRLFSAKVAGFFVTIIVPEVARRWGPSLTAGYQFAMAIMAIAGVLLFFFCFFTTKERIQHKKETTPMSGQLRHLVRNDQWIVLCAVCITGMIGYVIRGQTGAYYAKYYLDGGDKLIAPFMGIGVAGAILAMVASTWLTKSYCKIALFRWTQLAVGLISVVMFYVVRPGDVYSAFAFYFVLSFVVDLHAPIFWSIISESVDYGAHKTGLHIPGVAFGVIAFFQSMGLAIGGSATNKLLDYSDYIANQTQPASTLAMIALMLTLIPGAFHVVVGLLMFRYRITDKFYHAMMQQPLPATATARPAAEPA